MITTKLKRTISFGVIGALLIVNQSCCTLFGGDDCDTCNDIKEGIALADLLLNAFRSEQTSTSNESDFYKVFHVIKNVADGFECPKEVAPAGFHNTNVSLLRYEPDDLNLLNPQMIESTDVSSPSVLSAEAEYTLETDLEIIANGIYQVVNNIDTENAVEERNEQNNVDDNDPTDVGKGGLSNHSSRLFIVKHLKDPKDLGKNPVYVRKWEVKVYDGNTIRTNE